MKGKTHLQDHPKNPVQTGANKGLSGRIVSLAEKLLHEKQPNTPPIESAAGQRYTSGKDQP